MDFWDLAKGQASELSRFALHLYGICVNSASVERLWSSMGFLHSKRRNRLYVNIFLKKIKYIELNLYLSIFIIFY